MSKATILLAGAKRVATEQQAHGTDGIAHFQHVVATEVGGVPRLVPKFLATVPGGSIEMAVNGSVTPVAFDLVPGSSEIWRVARLVLQIVAPAPATPAQFGSLAALTNGLLLQVRNATTVITDLTAGAPVKANRDLVLGWTGVSLADTDVEADWLFSVPIRLEGGLNEIVRLTVRDNLSTLTRMRVLAEVQVETELT